MLITGGMTSRVRHNGCAWCTPWTLKNTLFSFSVFGWK